MRRDYRREEREQRAIQRAGARTQYPQPLFSLQNAGGPCEDGGEDKGADGGVHGSGKEDRFLPYEQVRRNLVILVVVRVVRIVSGIRDRFERWREAVGYEASDETRDRAGR